MAVKAGNAPGEQVQHGHLAEVGPLWQRAAQPEDCVEAEKNSPTKLRAISPPEIPLPVLLCPVRFRCSRISFTTLAEKGSCA